MKAIELHAEPLTREAFAPFGDVIDARGVAGVAINDGNALRFDDFCSVDVATGGGHPRLAIFQVEAASSPLSLRLLERHPLGTQAFVPLAGQRFVVVVALPGLGPDELVPAQLRAFVTDGRQGTNYRRGTWHHPLLALDGGEFLVLDRGGPGVNGEVVPYEQHGVMVKP
ncbi:MAG TPA: ureidoglycolate lyase [Thermoanaerobaculia bacterium]|nr:ureidoglycolate lyase [Thermoanaerobaculia bacterium]